jgi:hypothetical protein
MNIRWLCVVVSIVVASGSNAQQTKPFDFPISSSASGQTPRTTACEFPGLKLPEEFRVLAAGAYSGRAVGFQIDQSGHEAKQIDVAVNSSGKPVVLMLGAYEPTIWNIGWSSKTRILAVLVSGYHRQVVAGLPEQAPVLISTYDNKGPCGYFYVAGDQLSSLNPKARSLFGRPVEMVYPATNGRVVVGEALSGGTGLVTAVGVTPESYRDPSAPIAGLEGLEDAVRKGLLRRATLVDAEAWADAVAQNTPDRDLPPVAGKGVPKPAKPPLYNAYVVLGQFTYPAGLYGAHAAVFLIPKGVPKPTGEPGHSQVYDFNTMQCGGPVCGSR